MQAQEDILSNTTERASQSPVITVKHLYKSFASNKVLIDFNFQLHKCENVVVFGKSGSGKSVFIKCIIGLLKPDNGEIYVLGEDITKLDHEELDHIRVKVGFLFQSNALYDSMTVRENLEFPLRRHWMKLSPEESDKKVMEVLANVGLKHTVDMMPAELSGGMRKRIALARTLILRPDIMLYDEPTTGLDPITAGEISKLMVDIGREYKTSSIIISHDMDCIRATADRIVMLIDGRCYAEGTYKELLQNTDPKVKEFFENHGNKNN